MTLIKADHSRRGSLQASHLERVILYTDFQPISCIGQEEEMQIQIVASSSAKLSTVSASASASVFAIAYISLEKSIYHFS